MAEYQAPTNLSLAIQLNLVQAQSNGNLGTLAAGPIPELSGAAIDVTYDPTGDYYITAVNVQDALQQIDNTANDLFLRIAQNEAFIRDIIYNGDGFDVAEHYSWIQQGIVFILGTLYLRGKLVII